MFSSIDKFIGNASRLVFFDISLLFFLIFCWEKSKFIQKLRAALKDCCFVFWGEIFHLTKTSCYTLFRLVAKINFHILLFFFVALAIRLSYWGFIKLEKKTYCKA